MTKIIQRQSTVTRGKKRKEKSTQAEAVAARTEDNPGKCTPQSQDLDEHWLTTTLGEKERSRIRRQMKARLELERRMDEKRLKELVDDWCFEDNA
jgi:hypothetical protein